jgi:hypothetical protein
MMEGLRRIRSLLTTISLLGVCAVDPAALDQLREALQQARREVANVQAAQGLPCHELKDKARLAAERADLKLERAQLVLDKLAACTPNLGPTVVVAAPPVTVVVDHQPQEEPDQPIETSAVAYLRPDAVTQLQSALEAESFADDKLRVLHTAMTGTRIKVEDVKTLLAQFSFGDDRLKALSMMAPYLWDRANAFKILESFSFSDEKAKAEAILKGR